MDFWLLKTVQLADSASDMITTQNVTYKPNDTESAHRPRANDQTMLMSDVFIYVNVNQEDVQKYLSAGRHPDAHLMVVTNKQWDRGGFRIIVPYLE